MLRDAEPSPEEKEGRGMNLGDALLLDPYRVNVYIAKRTDALRGSGTISDPWNGSTATDFDDIFKNRIPALSNPNVQINIGPGEFETHGYADGITGGWVSEFCPKNDVAGELGIW